MKIFAHRQNDWKPGNIHNAHGAEIDVQFTDNGEIVAKHDPYWNSVPPVSVSNIVKHSNYDKFFVDIKQNMDIKYLEMIVEAFGDKLHALFDVPYPSALYAIKAGLPVYDRISEFEHPLNLTQGVWLDPLMACFSSKYEALLGRLDKNNRAMICSPELHGQGTQIIEVWGWIKDKLEAGDPRIEGLVTKAPDKAMIFFSEYL